MMTGLRVGGVWDDVCVGEQTWRRQGYEKLFPPVHEFIIYINTNDRPQGKLCPGRQAPGVAFPPVCEKNLQGEMSTTY